TRSKRDWSSDVCSSDLVGRLTVFPGIEFRSDQGGEPIHYISIFPEDCDLDHVWTTLQGELGLTPTAIQEKGGDEKVYIPIEQGEIGRASCRERVEDEVV